MQIPRIACPISTHKQLISFICLNQQCLTNNSFVACQCCVQDEHRSHKQSISALKVFFSKLLNLHYEDNKISPSETYSISLMNNIKSCRTYQSLCQVIKQIIHLVDNQPHEEVLTQQMSSLKEYSRQFILQEQDRQLQSGYSTNTSSQKILFTTQYVSPLFVFQPGTHYTLNSAHSVTSLKKQFLQTIKAKPSLFSFPESIQVSFYIKKIKPNWLGVGLVTSSAQDSLNTDDSKGYYLWISNGWMLVDGKQVPSPGFSINEKISIRYDKKKQLLIFFKNGKFYEPTVVELNIPEWDELYPCVVFFNKGDQVDMLP